jgi:hypothetical protein
MISIGIFNKGFFAIIKKNSRPHSEVGYYLAILLNSPLVQKIQSEYFLDLPLFPLMNDL